MKRLLYGLIDRAVIMLSSVIMYKKRYFSKSVESPDFAEQIRYVSVRMPEINGRGFYEAAGDTMFSSQTATVAVLQWIGAEHITIIYQYGYMERVFDFYPVRDNKFKKIFFPDRGLPIQANVIGIRTMVDGNTAEYIENMRHLSEFIASLCFYTKVNEVLVQHLKKTPDARVLLMGTGFGGAVVNLHRTYFNSANAYIPLFSGAALGSVFTESAYRSMTGKKARKSKVQLDYRLNFDYDFRRRQTRNVFPMLAAYDKIAVEKTQRLAYGTTPVETIDKGHYTGRNDYPAIRRHLLSVYDIVAKERDQNKSIKRWNRQIR